MIRRRFLQMMTFAGAGGLATLGTIEAADTTTVSYRVTGFTCITCAVGLETLLQKEKGIQSVNASYPDASVVIRFDPSIVKEPELRAFITDLGFSVASEHKV